MKTYRQLLFAVCLISASIGAFWYVQGAPTEKGFYKSIEKNNEAQTAPHSINWKEGTSQAYRVSMHSSMRLNTLGASADQSMQVTVNSMLEFQILKAEKNNALVGMQLSGLRLTILGQSDPEMNRILETPFRVHFLSGGVPDKFEFPEGLTAQEQTMLENIIRTFTVSLPEGKPENKPAHKTEWVASEQNASGFYEASYQGITPRQLEKSKRNFVALSSSPILATATITSKETIELNAQHNWISSMTVDETLQTPGKNGPTVKIVNQAKIELVANAQIYKSKNNWNFVSAPPISKVNLAKASIPKLSAEKARQQLIAELPKLDASNKDRPKLIHTLRDLLNADGSVPATLLEQMKTQVLSDRTRADLYLALELAATPEAQVALSSVITNPEWSPRDAMRATVALAGINKPSTETLTVLWDTAYAGRAQLSATATYTLGSMGSRMKAGNNPDYPALRDDLLTGAYGSSDTQQRATFIYALGNTRDPDVAGDVTTFLEDEQPAVRQAAALSLGLMQSVQSSESLVTRFQQESSSAVRGAIAESLTSLPIADTASVMVTMSNAIQIESDEKARHSMANFMGKNLAKHPKYKSVLQNLIRQEPSKRVRQTIAEALATL